MSDLKIMQCPSPNHGPRPDGAAVDMLILHYTGMKSGSAAMARLCDPEAKVSAHYLVGEDGAVWRMVEEDRRAWHAGVASWAGETEINGRSIGIELVNPGHEHGYRPFPEPQMAALETLAAGIVERHGIQPHRVLGHSDIAPDRKQDPGELFDWARLARAGIGLWPESVPTDEDDGAIDADRVKALLTRFGYDTAFSDAPEDGLRLALEAFQRHFRPARIDGRADSECIALLTALCARLP